MATPPRKSRPKSPARAGAAKPVPRKGPAMGATSRRAPAKPKLTTVEGGAAAPEARPQASASGQASEVLTRKELFDRIATITGASKRDVRQIADAALAILGQALAAGEELNLPPLGKVRVVKSRDAGAAEVMTLKLRHRHAPKGTGEES